MKIISLSNMKSHEAYALDKLLSYCAEVAFQEARADGHANESDEDITNEGIYALASSYMESLFVSQDDEHVEHVKKRLQIELNRWIPTSDPTRQELLIPIMAYALIVSNEYNDEAVRARINVDKKKDAPKKGDEYPYNRWKHVDPYSVTRSENPPKSDSFDKKLNAIKKKIKKSNDYSYCDNTNVIFVHVLLKNYQNIARCQDIARIGLFLRRILVDSHCDDKPMNSLIRMYLANHLDNIMLRSYTLMDKAKFCKMENAKIYSPLLTYYHEFESCKSTNSVRSEAATDLQISEEYRSWSFSKIYQELISNYTIDEDDLNLLLDFYFNANRLWDYGNMVDDTKALANAVVNYVVNKTEIPDELLSEAMADYVLYRLHANRNYPQLSISHYIKGKWKGQKINRKLCIPRIIIPKNQNSDNDS